MHKRTFQPSIKRLLRDVQRARDVRDARVLPETHCENTLIFRRHLLERGAEGTLDRATLLDVGLVLDEFVRARRRRFRVERFVAHFAWPRRTTPRQLAQ